MNKKWIERIRHWGPGCHNVTPKGEGSCQRWVPAFACCWSDEIRSGRMTSVSIAPMMGADPGCSTSSVRTQRNAWRSWCAAASRPRSCRDIRRSVTMFGVPEHISYGSGSEFVAKAVQNRIGSVLAKRPTPRRQVCGRTATARPGAKSSSHHWPSSWPTSYLLGIEPHKFGLGHLASTLVKVSAKPDRTRPSSRQSSWMNGKPN